MMTLEANSPHRPQSRLPTTPRSHLQKATRAAPAQSSTLAVAVVVMAAAVVAAVARAAQTVEILLRTRQWVADKWHAVQHATTFTFAPHRPRIPHRLHKVLSLGFVLHRAALPEHDTESEREREREKGKGKRMKGEGE